jgi:hypothetical protein
MIRRAALVVLALAMNPPLLQAQDTTFTVVAPSADVFKAPSNVTPVIGHVPRGSVLPIARNLGSWIKIAWPDSPDGVGYVHISMGRLGPVATSGSAGPADRTANAARQSSMSPAPGSTTASGGAAAAPQPPTRTPAPVPLAQPVTPRRQQLVTPASHLFGIGAMVGSTNSWGATMRAWPTRHVGIQFAASRDSVTIDTSGTRVTSTNFEPGVVFALLDHVADYVWVRPYVGSTLILRHQSTDVPSSTSDSSAGWRAFAGGEFMFPSAPQFGVSADAGYRRFSESLPEYEPQRFTVSISAHWYVK